MTVTTSEDNESGKIKSEVTAENANCNEDDNNKWTGHDVTTVRPAQLIRYHKLGIKVVPLNANHKPMRDQT